MTEAAWLSFLTTQAASRNVQQLFGIPERTRTSGLLDRNQVCRRADVLLLGGRFVLCYAVAGLRYTPRFLVRKTPVTSDMMSFLVSCGPFRGGFCGGRAMRREALANVRQLFLVGRYQCEARGGQNPRGAMPTSELCLWRVSCAAQAGCRSGCTSGRGRAPTRLVSPTNRS